MATEWLLCPMSYTDPSSDNLVGASFISAQFSFCSMSETHPSVLDIVGASFMTAYFVVLFRLCSVPGADTSPDDIVRTSFMTAGSDFCSVSQTYPSTLDLFCASVMTARVNIALCPMPYTHPSIYEIIGAFSN